MTLARLFVSLIPLLVFPLAHGEDKEVLSDAITYVGRWDFKNSQNGMKFGGDMKIVLKEKLPTSEPDTFTFKGKISVDGRETNDKCGTVGSFGADTPVDVLWEQKGDDVILSYRVPCAVKDPVTVTKRFKHSEGSITYEYSRAWGTGLEKLRRQMP
jgi:hypothetical protein